MSLGFGVVQFDVTIVNTALDRIGTSLGSGVRAEWEVRLMAAIHDGAAAMSLGSRESRIDPGRVITRCNGASARKARREVCQPPIAAISSADIISDVMTGDKQHFEAISMLLCVLLRVFLAGDLYQGADGLPSSGPTNPNVRATPNSTFGLQTRWVAQIRAT
jgi:hypothetical protein